MDQRRKTGGRQLVVVGSYASSDDYGIHALSMEEDGSLLPVARFKGITNPSHLAVHPSRKWLYAVSETGMSEDGQHGEVHALRIDVGHQNVCLTELNSTSTLGDHPCHLAIDDAGRWLAVTNYGSGDVVVFAIREDGSVGDRTARMQHTGSGPLLERQAAPHPHASAFSSDGRYVIVSDLGTDSLIVYALDRSSGRLRAHSIYKAPAGSGPRHLAFHPDGDVVASVNELNNTLTILKWDAQSGTLHPLASVSTLPNGTVGPNLAAAVRFSSHGDHLYVSNRGRDSIAWYAFNQASMQVTYVAHLTTGGAWPRDFVVTHDGNRVLVANERSDRVVSIAISGADDPERHISVTKPSCVVLV